MCLEGFCNSMVAKAKAKVCPTFSSFFKDRPICTFSIHEWLNWPFIDLFYQLRSSLDSVNMEKVEGLARLEKLCEENELQMAKEESLLPKPRKNSFKNRAAKILMYSRFTKTVLKYTDSYSATDVGRICF